ncbi:pseudouridine synthase [Mycoplasmopsis verecunda]|uniref:Pseudouridine synthase n=1 Tax=Mycoplasmopsis verecunda TaxID=171291 RepID=A0A1T4KEZ5_9BACT|nr:pseudouridine synthase [Mycoplasmopsis verecunda]WPB54876.1 pseudouridine synthase [Mycoplasmopsis verecunda]SJZ40905.1 23S rRNA pseudouridine2605 synthase [Mycoplasmopsis verecunda]
MEKAERLQKLLSQSGVASRREAEEMIQAGRITVNGQVAVIGQKATFKDDILVDGVPLSGREEKVYFVLNKPPKTVCTLKDNFNRTIVTDLIDTPYRIFPVGRLDYDTTGVLILTNDGELASKLLHPSYQVVRVYRARLNEPLDKKQLAKLNKPVMINGKWSKQDVIQADVKSYFVVLTQGTYHHVKELFKTVDREVINLKRVEYGGITCKNIPVGMYRPLTIKEVKTLYAMVKYPKKEEK